MTSVVVSLPATIRQIQVRKFGAQSTRDTDYTLTAGAATLDLEPTGADWCYQFTEHGHGGVVRFCVVPNSGSVSYDALVDVDPATLLGVVEPASPAWEATASAALAAASSAVSTAGVASAATARPASDRILYVSTSGTDSNSGRALGLPFLTVDAAATALGSGNGGAIRVAAGTYSVSSLAWLRSGRCLIGAGRNATVLNYTGSGTAVTSATPGVRAYGIRVEGLTLSTSTGQVGIDLDSISNSGFYEVTVSGFSVAQWRVRSAINGGSVYNQFFGCIGVGPGSGSSAIGFDVAGSGSNTQQFFGCGARSNGVGLRVTDSNHVVYFGGALESNNVGWVVESTSSALADNAGVRGTRFENNVTANWKIGESTGTNVRNTVINFPAVVTDPGGNVEAGNRLHRLTTGGMSTVSSAAASALGAWRFERTVAATDMPAFLVVDSNTGSGAPVTVQADTGRAAGFPFRAVRGGTTYWDVDAAGNMRQPVGSHIEMKERTDPAAPAADTARLYVRDNGSGKTQLVVRFPTGAIQVVATEP